jgi:outer membrane biosynthesis protein TonB
MRVVNAGMSGVQACYERALIGGRSLAGKAVFDWTVAPSGAVSDARLARSTLADRKVARCILRRVRGWRFPRPGCNGAVKVRFPFVFRQQGFR